MKDVQTFLPYFKSFDNYLSFILSYGDTPALSNNTPPQTYTYKQLVENVYTTASLLRVKIKPGDRILLADLQSITWVTYFLAVMINGSIAVPIDSRMSDDLRKKIIEYVQPTLIINPSFLQTIKQHSNKTRTNGKRSVISQDSPAEIVFTSGTMGEPKGVVLTHRNLLSNLYSVSNTYFPEKGSKILSILPLSHTYEQMAGLLVPLLAGCHIIYQSKLDRASLINALSTHHIDKMVVVPRVLEILAYGIKRQAEAQKKERIINLLIPISHLLPITLRRILFNTIHKKFGGELKTFVVGGAPLDHSIKSFFESLGFEIYVGYGLSEASPVLTMLKKQSRFKNSVGFPIYNVTVKLSPDKEILAKGDNISPGYWPNYRKAPTWLHTSDLGSILPSGELCITGRKNSMIIFSSGDKIMLDDIERIANSIQGVSESCAVAVDKSQSKDIVLVYKGTITEEKLKHLINKELPIFAKVKKVFMWPDEFLPRTHTLKLDRMKIKTFAMNQYSLF